MKKCLLFYEKNHMDFWPTQQIPQEGFIRAVFPQFLHVLNHSSMALMQRATQCIIFGSHFLFLSLLKTLLHSFLALHATLGNLMPD